ncbi:hypothetical protein QC763_606830 [Podospora pseudopauciseta]|uniref:NADH:ubiquinone oxidoreductase intermediate-associated protein 30 domain-containing protein n=1 Tax=Podospora pseudopauciseta TaxID=2093780 RepID=A0ABR0H5C5_9PEZI|nr:hypothetical protein QC763_606830 [Podospora pseudopauciseta]
MASPDSSPHDLDHDSQTPEQEEISTSPWAITSPLIPDPSVPPTLAITNNSRINRPLATHSSLSPSSYTAYLRHVQYGTYHSLPSCLLALDFTFRFPTTSTSRFSSAEITLTFTHTTSPSKPSLPSASPSYDPIISNFAPVSIIGPPQARTNSNTFEIAAPLTLFDTPFGLGPSVGVTPRWAKETTKMEEGQAELHGYLAQDDDHDEGANSVAWDMAENPVSKGGIFRSFRGVVLLTLPRPGEPFWMKVEVKPVVKFSLDPKRWLAQRLIGKRDDPILLDGKTGLGDSICHGFEAFDAEDFPWDAVLKGPRQLGEA